MSHLHDALRYAINEAIKNSRPKMKKTKYTWDRVFVHETNTDFWNKFKNKYVYTQWTQTKEDTETPKFKKVKQLLIDSATDAVRVKVWYQVYKPGQTYGIGVVDGVITDHPDYQFKGYPFDINKARFETVKICEQIIL